MLFEYIAHDWAVQAIFILAIAALCALNLVKRAIAKENDAQRLEQRQKDLLATERVAGKSVATTVE